MATHVYVRHLPPAYHETELRELVDGYGTIVSLTVWRDTQTQRSRRFGLVEFATPEEAATCIDALHNHLIEGNDQPLEVRLANNDRSRAAASSSSSVAAPCPSPSSRSGRSGGRRPFRPPHTAPSPLAYMPTVAVAHPMASEYQVVPYAGAAAPLAWSARPARAVHIERLSPLEQEPDANLFVRGLSPNIDELAMYRLFAQFGAVASVRVEMDLTRYTPKGYGFVMYFRQADANLARTILDGSPLDGRTLDVSFHKPRE